MPDITAMMGLAGSLKTAGEITAAMIGIRDGAKLQAKVIELNGIILTAQSSALSAQAAQFTLLEHVRALEEEVAQLKAWDAEKQHYEMKGVASGAFAYVPKVGSPPAETPHWLCVQCFDHGARSVLQDNGRTQSYSETIYRCPTCKCHILVHFSITPSSVQQKAKLGNARLSGEECPLCPGQTKVIREEDHPEFGFAGKKMHTLECVECGNKIERNFDPKNGYKG